MQIVCQAHVYGVCQTFAFESRLTFVAAQVGGAPGVLALESVSVVHGSVVVGARVVRAERLTALLFLALAIVTLDLVGAVDRGVSVGATDGVAVDIVL